MKDEFNNTESSNDLVSSSKGFADVLLSSEFSTDSSFLIFTNCKKQKLKRVHRQKRIYLMMRIPRLQNETRKVKKMSIQVLKGII